MSERPGGAPFVNHLPQSVIDRYEAGQHTAAVQPDAPFHVDWDRATQRQVCASPCTDPTHYVCPQASGSGETHHMLPRAAGETCRDCGKTAKQIREKISA